MCVWENSGQEKNTRGPEGGQSYTNTQGKGHLCFCSGWRVEKGHSGLAARGKVTLLGSASDCSQHRAETPQRNSNPALNTSREAWLQARGSTRGFQDSGGYVSQLPPEQDACP